MARQEAKCYNPKEEKKKTYVTSKVWYREFSRISNIGIAIIEKWITFRDRDALNSNPSTVDHCSGFRPFSIRLLAEDRTISFRSHIFSTSGDIPSGPGDFPSVKFFFTSLYLSAVNGPS